ncbi:MAG: cupredoxin domain-containing protein [Microthrixaceae bacterium]
MSDSPMGGMGHGEDSPVAAGARRITVAATSFEFMPKEITVTAGEDIAIALTSQDLLHDFTVDELDAHVTADKGKTAAGGLRADKPGRYTYYCSVTGHRAAGMEGTLIVQAA